MNTLARILGITFGVMMILLSLAVTAETLIRRFFSLSLGGVDELGGYVIAIAAPLAFAVALIEQAHIRINLLHVRMPKKVQGVLNALAALSMGILAAYLLYFTVKTVGDTSTYRSIAQTPWATPLIWPQSIWLAAMTIFAAIAIFLAAKAMFLLAKRDWRTLNRAFGPSSASQELEAELEDLKKREEGAAS